MVLSVSDGDTLSVVVNGTQEKVRLTGIDCPESDQPFVMKLREHSAFLTRDASDHWQKFRMPPLLPPRGWLLGERKYMRDR